jgi:hypothetical protein
MSDWDGKTERRTDAVMIAEIVRDIKTLLANQTEIKQQVQKTNGRVSALEKMAWTIGGGVGMFAIFELNKFISVLNQ